MELLDVVLTPFARRARTTVVAHTTTVLDRGLEPGEPVLLRDEDGDVFTAHVADLDFDLDDTRYRLTIGERVDLGDAHLGVAEGIAARGAEGVARIEALLHEARESGVAARRALRRVR